jgi:hypothetical protein
VKRASGWISAGLACTALLSGCGGGGGGKKDNASRFSGEQANVARVVDELQSAARDGAGARICSQLFTQNLAISIQRASRRPCGQEVAANLGPKTSFDVVGIQLRGTTAVAQVRDEKDRRSSLVFLRQAGQWRIARIGRLTS